VQTLIIAKKHVSIIGAPIYKDCLQFIRSAWLVIEVCWVH